MPQSPAIITGLHAGPVRAEPLTWPAGCGGECIFLGRTRLETHPQHGRLLRLAYEAYEPMAASLLEAMAKGTLERFGCGGVRVVHAIGVVPPGEASVVIQVAAPHRGAAFDACRHLIERIKHELPVWKREVWERGETFVEGWVVKPE